MRALLLWLIAIVAQQALGQVELPGTIRFTGPDGADRQITGLAHPASSDAALSAGGVRDQASTISAVDGLAWTASLSPSAQAYVAGMLVTMVPSSPSLPGTTLNIDGLGAREVVKRDGTALDTSDVRAGQPVRLIYDGERFLVLGTMYRPCPPGYSPAGRSYCIEDARSPGQTFHDAVSACAARSARLCSYSEWVQACRRLPGFFDTVTQSEWADDATNNVTEAKIVGNGGDGISTESFLGCDRGTTTDVSNVRSFRCCRSR